MPNCRLRRVTHHMRTTVGTIAFVLLLPRSLAGVQMPALPERPSWTVGDVDGELSFGALTDVARLGDGRVVVLDEPSFRLWLLHPDGRLAGMNGAEGNGPGRFAIPIAVATADSELFVLDQGASRVSVWAARADGLHHTRDLPLPGLFSDLCVMKSRIYLLGLWRGDAVHELGRDGRLLSSFDSIPPAEHGDFIAEEERGYQSAGRLVCDDRSGVVAVAPTMRGTLRAYGGDGRLRWRTVIPEFFEARLKPTGTGYRMSPDPATGRVTQTESSGIWSEGIWVQVRELDPAGGREPGELRSWSIDPATGRVTRLPVLPRLLLVDESWVFGESEGVVPRLSAWRIRRD